MKYLNINEKENFNNVLKNAEDNFDQKYIIFKNKSERTVVGYNGISNLPNDLFSYENRKTKDVPLIMLNDVKPEFKDDIIEGKYAFVGKKNIGIPLLVFIDVDMHEGEESEKKFAEEYKHYNSGRTHAENLEHCKNGYSNVAWLSGYSSSRTGTRHVCPVIIEFVQDADGDDRDTYDNNVLYELAFKEVSDHFTKVTGVKTANDGAVGGLHMGSKLCWDEGSVQNYKPLFFKIKNEEAYNKIILENRNKKEYTNEEVKKMNDDFFKSGLTIEQYKDIKEQLLNNEEFIESLKHRNDAIHLLSVCRWFRR